MSLCDTCREPGSCCSGFYLSSPNGTGNFSVWETPLSPLILMATRWLPFLPVVRGPTLHCDEGDYYGIERWECPLLGDDGRCTDYDNRPQLCRDYVAGSDEICVEHVA